LSYSAREACWSFFNPLIEQCESCSDNGIAGAPEISDQDAIENLFEKRGPGGRSPGTVNHITGSRSGGETPQPDDFSRQAPPGFIGMQHPRLFDLLADFFIPGKEESP